MDAISRVMHNWVFVLAVCATVEELGPLMLDSLELLPPEWRVPAARIVMVLGIVARIWRGAALKAQSESGALAQAVAAKQPLVPPDKS